MKCLTCNVEMVVGTAIGPFHNENELTILPRPNLTNETMKLMNVYKCPTCGHSEVITG